MKNKIELRNRLEKQASVKAKLISSVVVLALSLGTMLIVSRYRQQVFVAFGDIENSLARIHFLADQAAAQQRAVTNARRAANLATDRYRSGIVSYLEVVDASREALQAERSNAQLTGQRLNIVVQLIKSLGGGWQETTLATAKK